MILDNKSKAFKKKLSPIIYHSSIHSPKPTPNFIKSVFYPHIKDIMKYSLSKSKISINIKLKQLLENVSINNSSLGFLNKKILIIQKLYRSGMLAIESPTIKMKDVYKNYNLSKNEGYIFIIISLINLNYEKDNPFSDYCFFADFPEHLLSTYNLLCYHAKKHFDYTLIKNICVVLMAVTEKYIENISALE